MTPKAYLQKEVASILHGTRIELLLDKELSEERRQLLEHILRSANVLRRASSFDGYGPHTYQPTCAQLGTVCFKVFLLTVAPSVAIAIGGLVGVLGFDHQARLAAEQIAAGCLLHAFASGLYGQLVIRPPNDQTILKCVRVLDDALKRIERTEEPQAALPKNIELNVQLAGQCDNLRESWSFGNIMLFVFHLLGFSLAVFIEGAFSGQLTAVEYQAPHVDRSTFLVLLPFIASFSMEGFVISYCTHMYTASLVQPIMLSLSLTIDNLVDGIGFVALVDELEQLKDVQGNIVLIYGMFAICVLFGGQACCLLRYVSSYWGEVAIYIHAVLRSFGVSSIAVAALRVFPNGFSLWALIGFVITWTAEFVAESIVSVHEHNEETHKRQKRFEETKSNDDQAGLPLLTLSA